MTRAARRLCGFLLLCCLHPALALTLQDADGVTFTRAQPAQRIVSLAPHLTDMLLALQARAQIAGVIDDHTQRGAHAQSLSGFPVVADAASLNYERLLALQPDLVLAWGSGTPRAWIAQLRHLGLPVFVVEAKQLDDIATQLEQLGELSGHKAPARQQAQAVRTELRQLAQVGGSGPRLSYFYQVWRQPLYSLQGDHLLSQALALCGADNIVPPGPVAAPLLSPEFVLQHDPDLLLFNRDDLDASLAYWRRFGGLKALRKRQWLALDDRRLTRPGPDMLSALQPVCAQIASWRKRNDIKQR